MKRLAINWSNSDTVEVVDDPHGPFVRAKEAEAEVAKLKTENERLKNQIACAKAGLEDDLALCRDLADGQMEAFAFDHAVNQAGEWLGPLLDDEDKGGGA
jgi:hypothetical protein